MVLSCPSRVHSHLSWRRRMERSFFTRSALWASTFILDWNYDEDRCRIRTGHGPENMTRLPRFAISVIKSKGVRSVAQKMRQLNKNTRLVFDYLRMTTNSCATPPTLK